MVQVQVNGEVIADSNETIIVEQNHYFPPSSVKTELFSDSLTTTVCPWKGTAHYYNATVGGKEIKDIAWYYPQPKEKAKHIQNYIAFYTNKVKLVGA